MGGAVKYDVDEHSIKSVWDFYVVSEIDNNIHEQETEIENAHLLILLQFYPPDKEECGGHNKPQDGMGLGVFFQL